MLTAFVDDSGGLDSGWIVMAGYLGTAATWEAFNQSWEAVLADEPAISCFHASQAESLAPRGEWAGVTKPERDGKIDRLIEVVLESDIQPVCVRMRSAHYKAHMQGKIPEHWDYPYYPLFSAFTQLCAMLALSFEDGPPVEFVFDSHERYQKAEHGHAYYQHTRRLDSFRALTSDNIHYRNDRDFPPLQAADLLAWQVRRFLCSKGGPRRKHYSDLRSGRNGRQFEEFIVPPSALVEWVQAYTEFVFGLLAELGVSREEFEKADFASRQLGETAPLAVLVKRVLDIMPAERHARAQAHMKRYIAEATRRESQMLRRNKP